MAKKLVNESVIDKFVDKIFDALKKKKITQITKKMKDPELEKQIIEFNKDYEDLRQRLINKYSEYGLK